MKVNVIARLKVKSEKINDFIKCAEILIRETRNEKGCSNYQLFQEVTDDKNEFLFYEIYADDKALETHSNADYFIRFFDEVSSFLQDKPIIEKHNV